ncbi:hypothetical protein J6590_000173 [Homalodisca vitripennis]|nr:hypothetical protein J6590_000173 [Homalodisca vitripennis]
MKLFRLIECTYGFVNPLTLRKEVRLLINADLFRLSVDADPLPPPPVTTTTAPDRPPLVLTARRGPPLSIAAVRTPAAINEGLLTGFGREPRPVDYPNSHISQFIVMAAINATFIEPKVNFDTQGRARQSPARRQTRLSTFACETLVPPFAGTPSPHPHIPPFGFTFAIARPYVILIFASLPTCPSLSLSLKS